MCWNVYEGDWKNDVMEGKGKFVWVNGNVYEGNWKNGRMERKFTDKNQEMKI
jgi:1-phosphatidylinositol-4-phosphate 5-kinase